MPGTQCLSDVDTMVEEAKRSKSKRGLEVHKEAYLSAALVWLRRHAFSGSPENRVFCRLYFQDWGVVY